MILFLVLQTDQLNGSKAYSAAGVCEGDLVFANYGNSADFNDLDAAKVSLAGRVVIVRHGMAHLGTKVQFAQSRGAVGLIAYTDLIDDGSSRGITFPGGPWCALFTVGTVGTGEPANLEKCIGVLLVASCAPLLPN